MSVLERVYTTFNRLDQDFARSKKTRTEFITDKFGGDINVGSVIILDAIRAEGMEETPDNISKMSYIKDTFAAIQANAGHLDSLTSFNFTDTNVVGAFIDILAHAEEHETRQTRVSQKQLWDTQHLALHFVCRADGTTYTSPDDCQVLQAYNENMAGLILTLLKPDRELELGGHYKVLPGRRVKTITKEAVSKNIRD